MAMKLKELRSLMQDIEVFEDPKLELEQYPTGVEVASRMLFTINSVYGDFNGRTVVDLGCGTGMLSIGAAMLGSPSVIGIDIDRDALDLAQSNLEEFDGIQVDLVQGSVKDLQQQCRLQADTVIMNPPFGTRRKGADMEFLRAGLKIARKAVYSLHKTSTRAHIKRLVEKDLGTGSCDVVAQLRFDLPASYIFHKQKTKDVDVDLWRFSMTEAGR